MATLDARLKLFDLPLRGLPGAWSGETMSSHARSGRKRLWRSDLVMYDVDDLTSAEGAQLVPFHHLRVQVRFLRAREAADGHTTHKGRGLGSTGASDGSCSSRAAKPEEGRRSR